MSDDVVIEEEVVNELPEIDSVDVNVDIKGNEWTCRDIVPVKKITCIVPYSLLMSIKKIEKDVNKKFGSSNEFSIFIHGEFDAHGNYVVSDDFYIPKQTVSGASVEYLEEPDEFYNGCLHKHPDGCKSFSSVDERYINSNFEFSLLYVCKEINMGIININYFGNFRVQIKLDIEIDDGLDETINIDKITKKEIIPTTYTPNPVNTPKKNVNDAMKFLNKPSGSVPPLLPGFERDRDFPTMEMDMFEDEYDPRTGFFGGLS